MFTSIVLSIFFAATSLAFPSRIVNGTDAKPGEFPYIVSLQLPPNSHFCGGSILDARHILTAAHCVCERYLPYIDIQYGTVNIKESRNKIHVLKTTCHEDYKSGGGYPNDIAIIKLANSIQFSDSVKPTVLPDQGESAPGQEPSVLAGWGYPYSGGQVQTHLQRVDLVVYTEDDCESIFNGTTNRRNHLCSGVPEGGKGQCSGDSGGPLYANGKQVGIVSWSIKPCAIRGYPGVFTKVSSYVDWIRSKISY